MLYEFSEVLNDLIDYFLVADLRALLRFKEENALPDDLGQEFVTSDSGDRAVHEGFVLPVPGLDNFPYTIIFTLAPSAPRLTESTCRLQHRRAGYYLRVENRSLALFTWRALHNFTRETVEKLLAKYSEPNRPIIEIENGWYQVEVRAGWIAAGNGDGSALDEPAFEFVLIPSDPPQRPAPVDLGYSFGLDL